MSEVNITGVCDPKFSEIQDIFEDAVSSGFDTGANIAIEHQGKMVVNLIGGHKDREGTDPWTNNTILNVFSTTKAVTAICIARLVDQGKLDLSKNVSDYWPEYACEGKENTKVSDFMCHRAGMFGFQGGMPDFKLSDWDSWTNALASQAPFRTPGTSQGYHALTYGWLVGEIIRRVDGRSVGKYFEDEIAQPFGIDFKIGLKDEDLGRCSDILADPRSESMILKLLPYMPDFLLPDQLKVIKEMLKGGDYQVAFESFEDQDLTNTSEWRQAEIPSANGHGTAESLAKLFGILSTGCEREGKKIFSKETLDLCLTPLSKGPDTVLFGAEINIGVGFDLGLGMTTIGQPGHPKSIFGHCGVGGCVAFGDVENQLGYGFLCNRMHQPQELYKTSNAITAKLFEIIKS
jgi:CubicO group peptidase (beta-lactamase class C family)